MSMDSTTLPSPKNARAMLCSPARGLTIGPGHGPDHQSCHQSWAWFCAFFPDTAPQVPAPRIECNTAARQIRPAADRDARTEHTGGRIEVILEVISGNRCRRRQRTHRHVEVLDRLRALQRDGGRQRHGHIRGLRQMPLTTGPWRATALRARNEPARRGVEPLAGPLRERSQPGISGGTSWHLPLATRRW